MASTSRGLKTQRQRQRERESGIVKGRRDLRVWQHFLAMEFLSCCCCCVVFVAVFVFVFVVCCGF
jgi:hypothetical protein